MPFRHLLFNRRNGAPKRPADTEPISLDSARYFSLDNEFSTYRWPEHSYSPEPSPNIQNSSMMQEPQFLKHQQQHAAYQHSFDQTSMFPYNTMNGTPFQGSPYDYDSRSLSYSDMMDTDVSSISQGSVHSSMSSVSHLDVVIDDATSLSSLSRKPSVASSFSSDVQSSEKLCPLLTGQVNRCNPSLCGPDAPCLQFVNTNVAIPPIEECVPEPQRSKFNEEISQPIDFTTPQSSPQSRKPKASLVETVVPSQIIGNSVIENTSTEDTRRTRLRTQRSATKATLAEHKEETPKQTKKTRARQAHSLVERKYRENLNAKIQELHITLQRAQFGRSHAHHMINSHGADEDLDHDDDDKGSSKVKKSDVLIEAMDYVHHTEAEMRRMQGEIRHLNERIKVMENWMANTNSS